jgi:hypothetical protein
LGQPLVVAVHGLRRAESISVGINELVPGNVLSSQTRTAGCRLCGEEDVGRSSLNVKRILLIEVSESLLSIRTEILQDRNYEVVQVTGDTSLALRSNRFGEVSAIVIGHGASWAERREIATRLKRIFPSVPIVALLRHGDAELPGIAVNIQADDPVQWLLALDCTTGRIN